MTEARNAPALARSRSHGHWFVAEVTASPIGVSAALAGLKGEPRGRNSPRAAASTAARRPTIGMYLTDGRLTIDNAAAEQAICALAVGRRNWLRLGGDGGLKPTAVLLSISASIKRQGVNPWVYLKHVLTELPTRTRVPT